MSWEQQDGDRACWGHPRAPQAGGAAAAGPQPSPEAPAANGTVSLPRCGTDPAVALGGWVVCPHPSAFVLGFIMLGIKVADRNAHREFFAFLRTGSLCF